MPAETQVTGEEAAGSVARFLATHEECNAGFHISRDGVGRGSSLELICNGCGDGTRYYGGSVGLLHEHGVDATDLAIERRFRPSRETLETWLPAPAALPWWVPNAYIVGVIIVGLAMIAFGVLQGKHGRVILGDQQPRQQPVSEPASIAPSPPAPEPRPRRRATAQRPDLRRVVVLDRFAMGVPEGWSGGTSDGAIVFAPDSGNASVRVYLQSGEVPTMQMARRASDFLEREHPDGKPSRSAPLRLGPLRARALSDRYPGGRELVEVFAAGGYSYLIDARIQQDASRSEKAAAGACARSFRTA